MADEQTAQPAATSSQADQRVPVMQEIFDNIWFLFFASVVIVLVSYIIWALVEMLSIPTLP